MKALKNIVLLVAVMLFSSLSAQDPVWFKHYGPNLGLGFKLAPDGSNGVYGTGQLSVNTDFDGQTATVLGQEDIVLGRWDADGNTLWVRTAGGECQLYEHENGTRIAFDPVLEHVVITGTYNCPTVNFGSHVIYGSWDDGYDMFVAAYDNAGNCIWANGVRGSVTSKKLLVDQASVVHVIGNTAAQSTYFGTAPSVTVPRGGFVAKYSATGELISAERILVNGELNWADLTSTNKYILAGKVSAGAELYDQAISVSSPNTDGFVARTTMDGTVDWVTNFSSSNYAQIIECAVNTNGKTYATGRYVDSLFVSNDTLIGPPNEISAFFLSSISPTGEMEWTTPITSPEFVYVYDLKIGPDGDVFILGRFSNVLTIGDKMLQSLYNATGFVARFDSNGVCKAVSHFGPVQAGFGSVLPTENGIFVSADYDSTMVVGSQVFPVSQIGFADLFIAKFDSLSGFTGVQSMGVEQGTLNIYANPNNGLCTIDLPATLRRTNDLVLTIYDNTGQVVQQVPLNFSTEGVRVDIRAQAKGIYHVELGDGTQRYAGTIVFE